MRERTIAEISLEIDLRQRTINKFQMLACPLNSAVKELKQRLAYEKQMIDALSDELKERRDGE